MTERSTSTHRVGVLVFPGVTLLDVAGPAEVFVEANRYGARYEVTLYSPDGGPVRSSTGLRLTADAAVADATGLDTVLLPGADALAVAGLDPGLVTAATELARSTPRVVSVCTGAFLLAATGLLDGRRATTHWRHAATLARRYPRVAVEPDAIYVTDGPIASSAGVTAGIDLALALVEADHGPGPSREVARSLVVFLQRPGGQSQFSAPSRTPRPRHEPLRELLDTVAADPAGNYSVPELAAVAGVSPRHLSRLFQRELGTTPARHIERLRLEAAQNLLDAGHTVTSAAARSGFGSDENLRRAFVTHLGVPPATYRRRFGTTVRPR
ncbi:GlxA family transcriptional regulator [Micromonospora sp. NPDC050397]|uniref:GlxA family transcriptional regulator n=1 Tax=Micromonospora sp. NPDC050397 TaxID=3364279 RepID=UPI00384DE07D